MCFAICEHNKERLGEVGFYSVEELNPWSPEKKEFSTNRSHIFNEKILTFWRLNPYQLLLSLRWAWKLSVPRGWFGRASGELCLGKPRHAEWNKAGERETVSTITGFICCWFSLKWKVKSLSCVWLFVIPQTLRLPLRIPLRIPQNSPGKNIGMSSHSLFQGIFPTQGLNPGFLHCRQILCHLSHQRIPTVILLIFSKFS